VAGVLAPLSEDGAHPAAGEAQQSVGPLQADDAGSPGEKR
jgi:hypothetical protein